MQANNNTDTLFDEIFSDEPESERRTDVLSNNYVNPVFCSIFDEKEDEAGMLRDYMTYKPRSSNRETFEFRRIIYIDKNVLD